MPPDSISAMGFATSRPAMDGAVPWVDSKMARPVSSLMFAPGISTSELFP